MPKYGVNGRLIVLSGTSFVSLAPTSADKALSVPVQVEDEVIFGGPLLLGGVSYAVLKAPIVISPAISVGAWFATYDTSRTTADLGPMVRKRLEVIGTSMRVRSLEERKALIAEFVRANASSLGVSYIIYSQKIWSVDRAGEGWRYMSSRGSATADHYDHVHVSVY